MANTKRLEAVGEDLKMIQTLLEVLLLEVNLEQVESLSIAIQQAIDEAQKCINPLPQITHTLQGSTLH